MKLAACLLFALLATSSLADPKHARAGAFELLAPSVRSTEKAGDSVRIEWTGLVVNHSDKTWRGRLVVVFLDLQKREIRRARGDDFVLAPFAQTFATGSTLHPAKAWTESKEVQVVVDMWEEEKI